MNQPLIRPIAQNDIDGFHSCLDSVAREREYLGLTQASPLEDKRRWLVADMERDVIRLIAAIGGSQIVGWSDIESGRSQKWKDATMHDFRRVPFVTIIIALLITVIEVLILRNRDMVWANLSAEWTLLYSHHQPWRIIASPFLHHDLVQFFNNLVFLCLFGWQVERKYGSITTLDIFLGALVTSHVLCITFTHDWIVGISLGVCGLFGFSLIDNRRTPWWTTVTHRPLHALYFASLIGPLIPFVADMQKVQGFRTSHMSHIGGILYGLAFGVVFLLMPRNSRWRWAVVALPFVLFASQFYSPWQTEWRIVTKPPLLLSSKADCRLKSMEQEVYVPALITFINAWNTEIALYWLDYEGKPEFYFWLESGDSQEQQTLIGHPWCIVAVESGQALQAVMVTETQHIITVR